MYNPGGSKCHKKVMSYDKRQYNIVIEKIGHVIYRQYIYNKYGGHCAYCGNILTYANMQIDHIKPVNPIGISNNTIEYKNNYKMDIDNYDNLNPSCGPCNRYKSNTSLHSFRKRLKKLNDVFEKSFKNSTNKNCVDVSKMYNVLEINKFDGVFYFEKVDE